MTARVHQINVSNGGVPKLPVEMADIEVGGMVGDAQADTQHHGGPGRALCLFSLEVIEALQNEGHPIEPGFAGENLTIAGLDWSLMQPGLQIRIGADVLAEVTWPTAPCAKNAAWFAAGDFRRMSEDQHPGWSRWYARVLIPGTVARGDIVTLADE